MIRKVVIHTDEKSVEDAGDKLDGVAVDQIERVSGEVVVTIVGDLECLDDAVEALNAEDDEEENEE